ncbi:MAG TPA: DUF2188 domain-containing protein [Vicinamibacterales bacterium]|jgi:hypothetical protein
MDSPGPRHRDVIVSIEGEGWAVLRNGRPESTHPTRDAALDAGRVLAEASRVDLWMLDADRVLVRVG